MNEELTIQDIVLKCVTLSGRNEQDILDDYERRCTKLRVVPLYGQLKTAIKSLLRDNKVRFVTRDGHKLLARTRA